MTLTSQKIDACIEHLKKQALDISIHTDMATRVIFATDNSIHYNLPYAVIYPHHRNALQQLIKQLHPLKDIEWSCRGGGSSTCGQSLNTGIIIELSRYLHTINHIDLKASQITIEPGCKLGELQRYLHKYNMTFPVKISSSEQATIGGMVNTDAAGLGSYKHGRMHQHVHQIELILVDGSQMTIDPLGIATHDTEGMAANVGARLSQAFSNHQIPSPTQPRHLNGYNIFQTQKNHDQHLIPLICGSEGTLAVVSRITLKIQAIEPNITLQVLHFSSLSMALSHTPALLDAGATVIEFFDQSLIEIIRSRQLKPIAPKTRAILMIEWPNPPQMILSHLEGLIEQQVIEDPKEAESYWMIRKKAVGWSGRVKQGRRRAIPFIEDMAVAPQDLGHFCEEVKKILNQAHVSYVLYGHADAGCIHVRPILDIHQDLSIIESLTEQMIQLLKKLNGTLCGEHGHGYRSEWVQSAFDPEHYPLLQNIKRIFDPQSRLNRGQIVTIDPQHHIRKQSDDLKPEIPTQTLTPGIAQAIECNGNAHCLNHHPHIAICPSYKVSKDPLLSPRSRALLIRHHLQHPNNKALEQSLKQSLDQCLGCHACSSDHCPMHVNIPKARAEFYENFYKKHHRSITDRLICYVENHIETCFKSLWLSHLFAQSWLRKLMGKLLGFHYLPKPNHIGREKIAPYISQDKDEKAIYIIQDMLCRFFYPETLLSLIKIIQYLGLRPIVVPFFPSGILAEQMGNLKMYASNVHKNTAMLNELIPPQATCIGVDPSISIFISKHYKNLKNKPLLPQSWLASQTFSPIKSSSIIHYFPHCHEESLSHQGIDDWKCIFDQLNIPIKIHANSCCGAAGLWGLKHSNYKLSHECFKQHRAAIMETIDANDVLLSSGHSCLMQQAIHSQRIVSHPFVYLNHLLHHEGKHT